MRNATKILVRCPNWIGDQVLAYPFFFALRKIYPHATIAAVCRPWVRSIQFQGQVDQVFELPRSGGLVELYRNAREIRAAGPWDLAISLPNSFSAALHLFLTGAKTRIGYAFDGRSFLLTTRLPWDDRRELHRSQAYLNLLGDAGAEAVKNLPATRFFGALPENPLDQKTPGVLEIFEGKKEWMPKGGLPEGLKPGEPYVVFAPGATAESRRWSTESFSALAGLIQEKWKYAVVVVGGKAEKPLAQQMVARAGEGRIIDWTDRGGVSDLYSVFNQARFTVCNESGLAHVSALSGAMTQIVCGAADPRRTQPIGPGKVQVSFNPVECWPCEKNVCLQQGDKKIQCLRGISPEGVFQEIQRGLEA
ncbi:MAG: glycosyltransferase family 9 protein [Bdellovibrionales bacterium]|nr:glycosyltransferase family 9 protein [Bdellovibrionales bacterium]